MTQPAVKIRELDGALGVLPPGARLFALVGPCSKGPVNKPAAYGRITQLVQDLGQGPLVEAAAHYIERYGGQVVVTRTDASTPGSYGTLDDSGVGGTSTITAGLTEPLDDYEAAVEILTGGTVGTAGITYRWSLDGGRTWSPATALGTDTSIELPDSGVSFDLDAGDLEVGDAWSVVTQAPQWSAAELGAALDALRDTSIGWELVEVVGHLDGDALDMVDLKVVGMAERGKYRAWIGSFRMPEPGEDAATYRAAFESAFGSKSTVHGMVCAGACKLTSSVSGRKYRRPVAFAIAAREASVSEEVNTADVNLGALAGVSITDDNGNPDEHDESVFPGLDDSRACVLRTWDGLQGVYVNRPRLLSPEGSDFQLLPHRRVMNLAHEALRGYFLRRLNRPVRVDKQTGFILESDAQEIEAGARAAMRGALLAKPKASEVEFALSRTDNLLSTKTMTGQARVVPLAYPEFIELEVGFMNPALAVQAV